METWRPGYRAPQDQARRLISAADRGPRRIEIEKARRGHSKEAPYPALFI